MFSLQVFAGNFDRNSIVAHEILPPFYANLVKIHPVSYYRWMSMRVELYGCPIKVRSTSNSESWLQGIVPCGHKECHMHSLMGGLGEWVKPVKRGRTLYRNVHEMCPVIFNRETTAILVHQNSTGTSFTIHLLLTTTSTPRTTSITKQIYILPTNLAIL